MTKKTFSAQHIRPPIAKVLLSYGIDNLQLEIDLAAAVKPLCVVDPSMIAEDFDYDKERAKNGDERMKRLLEVRDDIQAFDGLNKNIYDWERGEWAGFDRWLLKRPEHQTIKGFVKWWLQDDFRRKQGTTFLSAKKIKENWNQAFPKMTETKVEKTKSGGYR